MSDSELSGEEEVVAADGEELSDEDLAVIDASGHVNSHDYAVKTQKRAAEFLSFIKEECVNTQVTVDHVVRGVDELFHLYNKFLQARILELSDTDFIEKKDIEEFFGYINQQTIFQGVQSKHKLDQYQKSRWNTVIPEKIVFSWKKVLVHGKVCQVPKEFAYYVDFLDQLQSLLQCADVLHCVDNPKPPSEKFRSILDGYSYQNHPVVKKDPKALAIVFYLDDIKPGDSLSSYQSLGLRNYLWTLANIYPELRSSVRAIQLLALSKASDAKKKNGPIIKNLIEGINKLSSDEGVTFIINGVPRVFHGFLLIVIGDYPALANLGGFKESAAFAWRFCRQCMTTQAEKSTKFEEKEVTLRSPAMHQEHLDIIEGTIVDEEHEEEETQEHEKPSVKFGVNSRSPLLDLDYFDITRNLPQDVMHLFMEGIMETECRFVLHHAVTERKLSLKWVNSFLENFDYGDHQTDKPSPIEPQHLKNGLRQTSSQILMLSILLPFIVHKHCDPIKMQNFILLLKIQSLCLTHELEMHHADLLKRMIKQYLMTFISLYPGQFTAKHHFLIHLPTQIILFSVFTEQWAMRYEAFHSILKRLFKILHNAKNLTFSLITRVSCLQAYKMHKNKQDFLTCTAVQLQVKEKIRLSEVAHCSKIKASIQSVEDTATQLSRLKWYGHEFKVGDIIMITPPSCPALPKFATVIDLFCVEERYVVLYRELTTVAYGAHLNAYEVRCERIADIGAIDITSNFNAPQLVRLKHEDLDYVIIKYNNCPEFY